MYLPKSRSRLVFRTRGKWQKKHAAAGRWLSVVSQNRYIPGIQHAKELIQAGKARCTAGVQHAI